MMGILVHCTLSLVAGEKESELGFTGYLGLQFPELICI
jgi:hypothetical protein